MPNKLLINRLDRITLVQKSGGKLAKHPELRNGVVEVVKGEDDWYGEFSSFITSCPSEDIPDDWCEAFSHHIEKAGKPNYPESRGPFAGPHNSFPIKTQQDVYDAARLVGHAKDKAAVKARIIRIARNKGFHLPKSWQSKVKKSDIVEAVKALGQWLAGDASLVEEDPEDLEKAKKSGMHAHEHSHVSTYGYSYYSHNHDHGHPDGIDPESDEHITGETAHGHAHISKAGEEVTPEEAKAIEADNAGLKADLTKAQDELKTLQEQVAAANEKLATVEKAVQEKDQKITEANEKLATLEKARTDAESARAEAITKAEEAEKKLTDASRQPLTAAPSTVTKAQTRISPDMSFDDALKTLLHS